MVSFRSESASPKLEDQFILAPEYPAELPSPTFVHGTNVLGQVWTEHEDSVYTAEWSSSDPWTFASLSFDGRLVLGHVPQQVKFSILNLG